MARTSVKDLIDFDQIPAIHSLHEDQFHCDYMCHNWACVRVWRGGLRALALEAEKPDDQLAAVHSVSFSATVIEHRIPASIETALKSGLKNSRKERASVVVRVGSFESIPKLSAYCEGFPELVEKSATLEYGRVCKR
jgi:hypothetical protein